VNCGDRLIKGFYTRLLAEVWPGFNQMNKRVLITGASRGIGRAISVVLAAQGFEVVLNYLRQHEAARATLETIQAGGGRAALLPFDVSDRDQARAAISDDMEKHGVYWGVVGNAGIVADAGFPLLSGEQWDRVIQTNLGAFFNVLHPVVLPMINARRGGRIVTLSSISGLAGNRGQTNYSAAKAGIIGATRSLAQELAKRSITVNSVAPGLIETDMLANLPDREEILRHIPMRRLGKPEEVASLVAYLFTEGAAYITGQIISVNGGII
jgi:3-oxoacyl-[acyl-carrier protein] reductase